jgi:hypothetical protein
MIDIRFSFVDNQKIHLRQFGACLHLSRKNALKNLAYGAVRQTACASWQFLSGRTWLSRLSTMRVAMQLTPA